MMTVMIFNLVFVFSFCVSVIFNVQKVYQEPATRNNDVV